MGIFAVRGRRRTVDDPGASRTLSHDQRWGLPGRLEAVGEALASGSDSSAACGVAGEDLARDGASLEEALEALRTTWQLVLGTEPSYDAISALLRAWGETTLGYLNQLSCEDPLTGLASQAHLRSRLSGLYRAQARHEGLNREHALVVCELPGRQDPSDAPGDHFTRAMRLARVGQTARTVFSGDETIARLGTVRVGILVRRDERLGRRVRVLRTLLAAVDAGHRTSPVWIEGLPGTDEVAGMLLDELTRH